MYTYSLFQQQHPLSPRKFWKKILGTLVGSFVFFIVFSILAAIFGSIVAASNTGNSHLVDGIIWGIWGAAALIIVIQLVAKAFYFQAYIRRYYYDCNENFVTIKKGVFAPTEIHVQYQRIQDVYVDQDFIDRIMGLYDVHIASATVTSGIEAHIDGVEQEAADGIKQFLLDKIKNGGAAPTAAGAAPQVSAAPAASAAPISFDGKVSSAEYPIRGKWLLSSLISSSISLLIVGVFLLVFATATTKQGASTGFLIYLLIYLAIFIYNIVWIVLWRKSYYFEFMPEYILLRDGVISKEERHLPYKSIQNVTMRQGFFDKLLGIGSVSIENAANQGIPVRRGYSPMGSGIGIPGQSIDKANELLNTLNSIVSKNANPAGMGL